MDFLKFINSNTVRNHLQELEYQPTAMKAAWLVYQCETLSLKENTPPGRKLLKLCQIAHLTDILQD